MASTTSTIERAAVDRGNPIGRIEQTPESSDRPMPCDERGGHAHRATGWSAVEVLAGKMFLYLAGLAAIFAVVEGVLMWQESAKPPPGRFMNRYPTPYVEFYSEPMYDRDGISTNSVGFRYGPIPKQKPPGETRIFFLGASTGFNGVSNNTTISGLMEGMFAGADHRVRVINACGVSFVTRQSLVLLVTRILDYEPDAIIVFQGPETLFYPVRLESRIGYPFGFKTQEAQYDRLAGYVEGPNPFVAAIAATRTMRAFQPDLVRKMVHTRLLTLSPHVELTSVLELEPHIEGVVGDIGKMIHIAASFGCRTVVALPPWVDSGINKDAIPVLADRLQALCERSANVGAVFVDTTQSEREMTDRELWKADGIHWTFDGNQIMATLLVDALRENEVVK